jgi:predicted hydrocarbon binding protein
MNPKIPIQVDEKTGMWSTDGLPMLYMPRHFFNNNHNAIEASLGREKYAKILYQAGYKSAFHWCEKEAETHQLTGMAVYEHYLNRLSQRGWGRFSLQNADPATGSAEIKLEFSSFVLAEPEKPGKLCYMFAGWFAGAMDWVIKQEGHSVCTTCSDAQSEGEGLSVCTTCSEAQCEGEGHQHCIFTVKPLTP